MTQEQIAEAFKRHVRLCAGIGQKEMLRIVNNFFEGEPLANLIVRASSTDEDSQ